MLSLAVLQLFDTASVVGVVLLVLVLVTIASAVEVVHAYENCVLTVFGEYRGLLEPGLHVVPPFVSQTDTYDMRTHGLELEEVDLVMREDEPVVVDATVYVRVLDPEATFRAVDDWRRDVHEVVMPTLRDVIERTALADLEYGYGDLSAEARRELQTQVDDWGIRIESVEIEEVSRPEAASSEESVASSSQSTL